VAPARAAAPGRAIKSVGIQELVVEIAATATDDGIITVDDGDKKPAAVQFGRHAYHRTTIEAGHRTIMMVKRGAAELANDDPEVVWDKGPGESLVNLVYRTAAPAIDEPVDQVVISNTLPLLPLVETVEAKDAEEDTEEEMKPAVVDPGTVVDQGPPMLQKSAESEDEEAQKAVRHQEWICVSSSSAPVRRTLLRTMTCSSTIILQSMVPFATSTCGCQRKCDTNGKLEPKKGGK
jgi:hypothetical protein